MGFPSAKSESGHITNISKVRAKINESCGIQFTFHDLRRTMDLLPKVSTMENIRLKSF
jgi:integrase